MPNQPNAEGQLPAQIAVESSIATYDWGNTTTPIETVSKTWSDQFKMTSQSTLWSGGQAALNVFCYSGTPDLVTEKDEYGFGVTGPSLTSGTPACGSPTPTRKTTIGYSFGSPCQTIIYDSNSTKMSETDTYIDGGTSPCVSGKQTTSTVTPAVTATTHDETNYAASATVARGNPTQVTSWANVGTAETKTYTFDATGQATSITDALGTTTLSHSDSPTTGNPGGNSNAYLTTLTRPQTNGVNHISNYKYNYVTGKLIEVDDENSQATTYQYNDSLLRLTDIYAPASAQNGNVTPHTQYSYVDGSSASVTTAGPTGTKQEISFDGLGHAIRSQQISDTDLAGPAKVDTTYDGFGRVQSVSNPYRVATEPTYGITSYTYDGAGRKLLQCQPDNSSTATVVCVVGTSYQKWSYNGPYTTYQDERGSQWQRQTDAFGRLVQVLEPTATVQSPTLETDYTYDGQNNLIGVTQKGAGSDTSRSRSFTYDSLSRLLCASNPENSIASCPAFGGTIPTGVVSYVYNGNGDLTSKTDARGITIGYTYDALNRLLAKSYPTGTPSSCFQYDSSSLVTSGGYLIGRLTNAWTQSAACPSSAPSFQTASILTRRSILSYDAMGRVVNEQQCTYSNCSTSTSYNPSYDYDLAGHMIHHSNGVGNIILTDCYDVSSRLSLVLGVNTSCAAPSYSPSALIFSAPTYNANGSLAIATLGTGVGVSRSYDVRGRIIGETDKGNQSGTAAGTATITITGTEQVH
jgi:YD repeat-containing protein